MVEDPIDLLEGAAGSQGDGGLLRPGSILIGHWRNHTIEIEAGILPLPGSAVCGLDGPLQLAKIEQGDLRGSGKQGQPKLLRVAVKRCHPTGIHPAATVGAGLEIFEIPEDGVV